MRTYRTRPILPTKTELSDLNNLVRNRYEAAFKSLKQEIFSAKALLADLELKYSSRRFWRPICRKVFDRIKQSERIQNNVSISAVLTFARRPNPQNLHIISIETDKLEREITYLRRYRLALAQDFMRVESFEANERSFCYPPINVFPRNGNFQIQ